MRTHTLIIGGGQAGLATSAGLARLGVDHVVLERGRIANAWRTERWDSFRLLSPNWMTRLPGYRYDGTEADGYMTTAELLDFFDAYAGSISAPVEEHTSVCSVRSNDERFVVRTSRGRWIADAVVVATGATAQPRVPAFARCLPADVAQFTPGTYKRPTQLPDGAVLVVGASASGAQLASELAGSGRDVVLAVGSHTRLPRRYRGADVMWWMHRSGLFDDRASNVGDIEAARRQPSVQLVGSTPPRDLDLTTLQQRGVRLTGRLLAVSGTTLHFADDLRATTSDAEARLTAVLDRIDAVANAAGDRGDPTRPAPVKVSTGPSALDVHVERITSVIWATGYERSYPWLHVPVLDGRGEIRQHEGLTRVPGLYTIGMRFQRVRKSSFLDGVGDDALLLAEQIAARTGLRVAA